jgi:hypothetical protein
MRAEIPGSEILTLAPARHEGLLEHHVTFDQAVAAFVARCSTRPEDGVAQASAHSAIAVPR